MRAAEGITIQVQGQDRQSEIAAVKLRQQCQRVVPLLLGLFATSLPRLNLRGESFDLLVEQTKLFRLTVSRSSSGQRVRKTLGNTRVLLASNGSLLLGKLVHFGGASSVTSGSGRDCVVGTLLDGSIQRQKVRRFHASLCASGFTSGHRGRRR